MTITGAVLGTPAYMAPEQAWGRRRLVTVSTDVYGLGAVLYTLLTGKPPFTGDSDWETLVQVREQVPVQPSLLTAGLPRDLEIICLKCLEKDPQRRYASAQEVASDLRRFLAGEPITARRAMPWERAWLWCKRNPWLAAANVTAAAVTTILAIGSTIAAKVYYDKSEKIADQAKEAGAIGHRHAREAVRGPGGAGSCRAVQPQGRSKVRVTRGSGRGSEDRP